jgi:uncharacterized protein (TIGR00290 family)
MNLSLSWSSGKDAALAYFLLQQAGEHSVLNLHTTVNAQNGRVGLHGTPRSLVEAQAKAIGLPIEFIEIPSAASNQAYEFAMENFCIRLKEEGIEGIAYGDIFLEDLRKYREAQLAKVGLQAYFPLWGKDTGQMAQEILSAGLKTIICAADADLFSPETVGQIYNKDFLQSLPPGCDPCGERGEFHTFVANAPFFTQLIKLKVNLPQLHEYELGAGQPKKGFWFADLALA